jgi:hypothetical protein
MKDINILLIFFICFGFLTLFRASIKENHKGENVEKENYENLNLKIENFTDENEYVPKKIYMRGTGLNENGYNLNYEGNMKNPTNVKWNSENYIDEQNNLLIKYKSHDAKYTQLSGFDKKDSGLPQTYIRNGDFLKTVTSEFNN